MANNEIKQLIEALVFVSSDPLTLRDLQKILDEFPPEEVKAAAESLEQDYESDGGGLVLGKAAGGYQLLTMPSADPYIRKMLRTRNQERLTMAALETLAIIAYKQPITLPEILALRRVNSTGVIKTLLDKSLVKIIGRKKVVGNPILYGTTKEFLQRFGLNTLKDLPSLEEFQSLAEASGIELSDEPIRPAAEASEVEPVPEAEEAREGAVEAGPEPRGQAEGGVIESDVQDPLPAGLPGESHTDAIEPLPEDEDEKIQVG